MKYYLLVYSLNCSFFFEKIVINKIYKKRKAEKRKNWWRYRANRRWIAKEGTGKRAKRPQSRRWFRSHGTPLHNIKRIAIINSDGPYLKITVQTYVFLSSPSPSPFSLLGRRASKLVNYESQESKTMQADFPAALN